MAPWLAFLAITTAQTGTSAAGHALITGSVTTTYQYADQDGIDPEWLASADLYPSFQVAGGTLAIHLEAASSIRRCGVAAHVPEANADAASAVDNDGHGRLQLSQLKYRYPLADRHRMSGGLLDLTEDFDLGLIGGDETTQFLGNPLVQNPTIDFPDYTLGAVYSWQRDEHLTVRTALSLSEGIADNPRASYGQLLEMDEDEGAFAIASVRWAGPARWLEGGVWYDSAHHDALDGSQENLANYGSYAVVGARHGNHGLELRLGQAREKTTSGYRFTALTYEHRWTRLLAGAGAAYSSTAEDLAGAGEDLRQYEGYLRYHFLRELTLTASVQHIVNSQFTPTPPADRHITIYGLRLHATTTWLDSTHWNEPAKARRRPTGTAVSRG